MTLLAVAKHRRLKLRQLPLMLKTVANSSHRLCYFVLLELFSRETTKRCNILDVLKDFMVLKFLTCLNIMKLTFRTLFSTRLQFYWSSFNYKQLEHKNFCVILRRHKISGLQYVFLYVFVKTDTASRILAPRNRRHLQK